MSKKFMRITVDNGTPHGEVHTFPLEKVRNVEVVERLWDRIQNYIFGTDPTLESLTSVQKSMDDFMGVPDHPEIDAHKNLPELHPDFVQEDSDEDTKSTKKGQKKAPHHCSVCGAEGRQKLTELDYCLDCVPEDLRPKMVGGHPIEEYLEMYPSKPKKTKKKGKKGKKDHTPLTAEQRATFAQRRLALVGTEATFPDGSVWKVIEHIRGSQYRVQANVTKGASRFRLGTTRKVTKFASHSTKSGWKDWEVRL